MRIKALAAIGALVLGLPMMGWGEIQPLDGRPSVEALEEGPEEWVRRFDEGSQGSERLLNLSDAEFSKAVASLEQVKAGDQTTRIVWMVAMNFKRRHEELPREFLDRAAAALVKVTEVEDDVVRRRNLGVLAGVDHELLRDMLDRLTGSGDDSTVAQARRNLDVLAELERIAPPKKRPVPETAVRVPDPKSREGKGAIASTGADPGGSVPVLPGTMVSDGPAMWWTKWPVFLGGLLFLAGGFLVGRRFGRLKEGGLARHTRS